MSPDQGPSLATSHSSVPTPLLYTAVLPDQSTGSPPGAQPAVLCAQGPGHLRVVGTQIAFQRKNRSILALGIKMLGSVKHPGTYVNTKF